MLIIRALKRLEKLVSVCVVNPYMGDQGWTFERAPGVIPDPVFHAQYLHEIYTRSQHDYSGSVTVPVLWDLAQNTIVSNESSEIMRMLNAAFDGLGARRGEYAPVGLLPKIDAIKSKIDETVNDGVYKVGFATTQAVYEQEVARLFASLDCLENRLQSHQYLLGGRVTVADWRLFATLIRFDTVYYGLFKCNLRRLTDYPNLWRYTRELYQWPGVAETVNFDHIKQHYYRSYKTINPSGIVPIGQRLDLERVADREALGAAGPL